jgi:hypothetical protein
MDTLEAVLIGLLALMLLGLVVLAICNRYSKSTFFCKYFDLHVNPTESHIILQEKGGVGTCPRCGETLILYKNNRGYYWIKTKKK